ncbi:LacI family DNA-binding transcriptional regulator [Sphingobium boeckii]|uniref:DNA-binding LacI/PurR family transcriptional regulator n=1 Tax=Sphingobium boeckii TaxID=1082345 RepID=A0A7W9EDI9_9SPHN|nr:LacI family DNA-binding transcriptional regulator [Sphingobium boeckii]MBB5685338.1 DNA-binding LacI/PurR family transcriptional regulator [Sphingobium boeckii]
MAKPFSNRRINAGDVAKLAQVSRSAVSRTFTPGASVAPATRSLVLAAAKSLGYQPSRIPLPEGRSKARPVGVIIANMHSHFREMSDRLDDELTSKGLHAIFFLCSDVTRIDGVFKDVLASHIQGMIIFSAAPSAQSMAAAQAAHVPVVILNRGEQLKGASLVWIDGPELGRSVAKLMLDEGRRRPLAIAANPGRSRELECFADAMEAAGSAACRWIDEDWQYEGGVRAAAAVLNEGDRPDAIFAATDSLAIGFLDAARTLHGMDVPRDMSIIGFGNTAASHWISHRVSTVHVPMAALVQTAVSTLMARIGSVGDPAPRIWLGCDIIERDTSRGLGTG